METTVIEGPITIDKQILRYPHLLGGSSASRLLSAERRLEHLRSDNEEAQLIRVEPFTPTREKPFVVHIRQPVGKDASMALIKLQVRFPSGTIRAIDYKPTSAEVRERHIALSGFQSSKAGDLYVSARIYYSDGSAASGAILRSVLSANPDQLVITPRLWLVSGRAGRVEYDYDTNRFHCRANGTITNGSTVARTYRTLDVRVTDGGVDGTLVTSFSLNVGPFTVQPGDSSTRSIDTSYGQGGDVWDKFSQHWDLTVKFSYRDDTGGQIVDWAAYRPMSTVFVNAIKTTDFSDSQRAAVVTAVTIASEILEERDVTFYEPRFSVLSNQSDKDRFGLINIGWTNNDDFDFDEAHDLYEEISGEGQDRLDVFIPLNFTFAADVPTGKRGIGGFSNVNGPYPKDDNRRNSGNMVLLDASDLNGFGQAIAHEVCHYLGLTHREDDDFNLMQGKGKSTALNLDYEQWETIIQHGMMQVLAFDI